MSGPIGRYVFIRDTKPSYHDTHAQTPTAANHLNRYVNTYFRFFTKSRLQHYQLPTQTRAKWCLLLAPNACSSAGLNCRTLINTNHDMRR